MKNLLLCCVLLAPSPALGFTCDGLDRNEITLIAEAKFVVLPGADRPAPTNTRVRVRLDGPAKGLRFTLHKKGKGGGKVPAEQRFLARWGDSGVELTPRQPLAAGGRYEVRVSAPEQETRAIGEFSVGADADIAPPAGRAVRGGKLMKVEIHTDGGTSHIRHVALEPDSAKDDRTSAERLLYLIWELPAGLPEAGAPPKAWLLADEGLLLGQTYDLCAGANYPLPGGKGKLRLVVRAQDEAGNLGEPAEVAIDLAKATRKFVDWNPPPEESEP